jgi:benzoyl-CoA reductase/2-hydroxyglutaryl-CoA dehydratase subunit BcrC/BadD/HgdB
MRIEEIVSILGEQTQYLKTQTDIPGSDILYFEGIKKYYQRILEAKNSGRDFCWAVMYIPVELFYAMDIAFLDLELHSLYNLYMEGSCESYLELAASHGFPIEICSLHRVLEGMNIKGDLPAPDFVITSSQCCDLTITFGDLSQNYGKNSFILDWPYKYDADGLSFYTKELEELVSFLQDETGKKLSPDRLEETVRLSYQTEALYRQIYQMRKKVPCPLRNSESFKHMLYFYLMAGTPEALAYFQQVCHEMETELANGQSPMGEERFRLLFLYLPPVPYMDLLDWLEKEYGAVVAMDSFSSWWLQDNLDPSQSLRSLAKKGFYNLVPRQVGGPLNYWLEEVVDNARQFKIDGAVQINHIGCKQGSAATRALIDSLKKFDIPTLIIDLDVLDPSVTSKEEIMARFEEFFERLEQKRSE